MRIVTWNCNLSLGRKLDALLELNPDLAIVQECEQTLSVPSDYTYVWTGQNIRKGLGVLARDPEARPQPAARDEWTYFLPVTLPTLRLRLLAVWAYNHRAAKVGSERTGYVRDAVENLEAWLSEGRSIVAGDFNNCAAWDRPGNPNNMAEIASHLGKVGLRSAYHEGMQEPFGDESLMTHYHQRNPVKGYHIDYCFVHKDLGSLQVTVPRLDIWRRYSDHVPIVTAVSDGSRRSHGLELQTTLLR